MSVGGYQWDAAAGEERLTVGAGFEVPPCSGFVDCHLEHFAFPGTFEALSGLEIKAQVGDQERAFFMDDLSMSWYNNSCEAGLERQMSRK